MSKVEERFKSRLSETDIKLIESFDDDKGWLMLDEPEEVKMEWIEKNVMARAEAIIEGDAE